MQIDETALADVHILTPKRHGDDRGFFEEVWNRETFAGLGLTQDWVQDNRSLSARTGTLRGLHYQAPPRAQAKLVRCGRGRLFDVAVDARVGSPGYGKWVGVELTPENGRMLLIPAGFLHGFVTREADTEILYKCSDTYSGEHDGAVAWNSLEVDWDLSGDPVLSDKDRAAPAFGDWQSPFTYEASR